MAGIAAGPYTGNGDVGIVVGSDDDAVVDIYHDLTQLWVPPDPSGCTVCGYAEGGKRSVGLLSLRPRVAPALAPALASTVGIGLEVGTAMCKRGTW
eukprot:COSAG06_NODE_37665_length_432_cov_1.246246_1_plen_95_part_10